MGTVGSKMAYVERILLVCGEQNAGKSRLLRHMLGDHRLGGVIPKNGRVGPRSLSQERRLVVRITSPHEMGESPDKFLEKINVERKKAGMSFRRMNYASAIQPHAFNQMPDIVGVCNCITQMFSPERIRVVVLSPDQNGDNSSMPISTQIDDLRKNDIEVLTIDARRSNHSAEPGNIRILADFFDFS